MNDILDWAEKAGAENMKFRLACADVLAKDAGTTLTILLAGVGGALAFAAKGLESPSLSAPMMVGACTLSIWFMVLAAVLIHFCVKTSEISVPTNDPANLYQPACEFKALREIELTNLQVRINQVRTRNARVAAWLDRIRYLAAACPVVFAISALVAAYWPALFVLV
jgi:hypothetical protein